MHACRLRGSLAAGCRAYLAKFPIARDLFRGRSGGTLVSKVQHTRLYVVRPRRAYCLDNRLGFGERQEVFT